MQGLAGSDHTTLLLNCYTKLRDLPRLDAFLDQMLQSMAPTMAQQQPQAGAQQLGAAAGRRGGSGAPLAFDADAAIKVLRAAGYWDHVLRVARAAGRHADYLDALLEGCSRHEEALSFIRGLPRRKAAAAVQLHGKALLALLPVEATALVMELCLPPAPGGAAAGTAVQDTYVADISDFEHLYTDRPQDLLYACVAIINMAPPGGEAPYCRRDALYRTLLDLYLSGAATTARPGAARAAPGTAAKGTASVGGEESEGGAGRREALELLRRGWPPGGQPAYNVELALVACRLHRFQPGLLFIYQSLRLYREAAAVLMDAGDWDGLVDACTAHGDARCGGDPALWGDALECFGRLPPDQDCSRQVSALLSAIEAGGLLPPLAVLGPLSRNSALTLGLVRDYVARALQADDRSTRADAQEAERLRDEAERTRAQVERLRTEPVVFQSSRDAATGTPLELPSVHFLCGHSFHLRTLGEPEEGGAPACPLCAPDHARAAELARSSAASATDRDTFFKQLRSAPDGWSLMCEYFGRGLLNHTSASQPAGQ